MGIYYAYTGYRIYKATKYIKFTVSSVAKYIKNAKRVKSALEKDAYHRAPSYLSLNQLKRGKIYKFKDRGGEKTLLQVKVTVNGKKGIAEYVLNKKGQVEHQLFRPNTGYTGKLQGHNYKGR